MGLTSLGPCSLSILPVSLAYLAGFGEGVAWRRSASFCSGVVSALVLLGSASALFGLACFGAGQVLPLMLAGSLAAALPRLLALRSISRWIPPISGAVLVGVGGLSLLARLP